MENCIFCTIAKGEIPCTRIWEDENFLAFLDVNPFGEGHTLIITKKHFDDLESLDKNISNKYIEVLQKVGKILMEKYHCDGFNIILNNGKSAGQIVRHVHFHLIPRKKGDGLKFIG